MPILFEEIMIKAHTYLKLYKKPFRSLSFYQKYLKIL